MSFFILKKERSPAAALGNLLCLKHQKRSTGKLMQISARIYTVRYECFFAELYLMKDGEIRRRLIIRDKAMQDHLKKPARSDWICEGYELFDIALVKKHTIEKFKAIYRTLPPHQKQKTLPASPIQLSLMHDVSPRTGTLVSFGYYDNIGEFSIDLIDQKTGSLVRISGAMLEDELLLSGADRNDLINIQPTKQEDVLFTETQYNPDGKQSDLIDEQTITHYEITKLEKNDVQQTNSTRICGPEANTEIYTGRTSVSRSQSSHFEGLDEQDHFGMGVENELAQADVFREAG